MKKSNWIIMAIAVLSACFFLGLWYYLHFDIVDNPLDLVLTIVWWVLVAVACIVIHKTEQQRQERIRTCYVGSGVLFNSEYGVVGFGTSNSASEKIEELLKNLEYNFNREEIPLDSNGNSTIKFTYIVRTKTFQNKKNEDNLEELKWEGEVVTLSANEVHSFTNAEELRALIG
ncbi:MAG: hypothetical protein ACI4BI_06335 [Anaerotardibacter sp.]